MQQVPSNIIRRFLKWWMDPRHGSPWVHTSIAIDMTNALAYLEGLNADPDQPGVTLNHLVTASIGRVLDLYPVANRRIIGSRLFQAPDVGVAAPVNLLDTKNGHKMEVTMVTFRRVDQKSLREVAAGSRKTVASEKAGKPTEPVAKWMIKAAELAPEPVMHLGLSVAGRLMNRPSLAALSWKLAPVSAALTNPGAAFPAIEGVLLRGGGFHIPTRLIHVGTLWGLSVIQEEVIPIEGKPAVRPMLPVVLVFDHRLFDGVMASRILSHFSRILLDPEGTFGSEGSRTGGSSS